MSSHKSYKIYRVFFSCGCFHINFKHKKEIYKFCKIFDVLPVKVDGFNNVIGPAYALAIERRANGKGWKLV